MNWDDFKAFFTPVIARAIVKALTMLAGISATATATMTEKRKTAIAAYLATAILYALGEWLHKKHWIPADSPAPEVSPPATIPSNPVTLVSPKPIDPKP